MKETCKTCKHCCPSYKGYVCEVKNKRTKLSGGCEKWTAGNSKPGM